MKVKVNDIKSNGLELDRSVDPQEIGLTDTDVKCASPVTVHARLEKLEDGSILANTDVKATFDFMCGRCLDLIKQDMVKNYVFNFEVDKTTETIDLGEEIRQEMILSFPQAVVCKEECLGICSGCGANLNLEECGCKVTAQEEKERIKITK